MSWIAPACISSCSWHFSPEATPKSCFSPLNFPTSGTTHGRSCICIVPAPWFSCSEFLAQMLQSFCFSCHSFMHCGLIKRKKKGGDFVFCLMPTLDEAVPGPCPVPPATEMVSFSMAAVKMEKSLGSPNLH